MGRKLALFVTLLVVMQVCQASAQRRGQPAPSGWGLQEQAHKLELTPYGGYVWTTSERVVDADGRTGDVDIESNGFWGVLADINVRPGMQAELLYQRSDTKLTFRPTSTRVKEDITDMAVEYWQIGAVQGVQRDQIMPFGMVTFGATHYIYDSPGFENSWRFSMILGLGAKFYVNEKIALRVQGRMPYTFFGSSVGFGVGTGGGYVGIGGYGVAQWDLSLGLAILL